MKVVLHKRVVENNSLSYIHLSWFILFFATPLPCLSFLYSCVFSHKISVLSGTKTRIMYVEHLRSKGNVSEYKVLTNIPSSFGAHLQPSSCLSSFLLFLFFLSFTHSLTHSHPTGHHLRAVVRKCPRCFLRHPVSLRFSPHPSTHSTLLPRSRFLFSLSSINTRERLSRHTVHLGPRQTPNTSAHSSQIPPAVTPRKSSTGGLRLSFWWGDPCITSGNLVLLLETVCKTT